MCFIFSILTSAKFFPKKVELFRNLKVIEKQFPLHKLHLFISFTSLVVEPKALLVQGCALTLSHPQSS